MSCGDRQRGGCRPGRGWADRGTRSDVRRGCHAKHLGLRGATLSRLTRRRDAPAPFGLAQVIATGVDRLGPVQQDSADGPVAWQSTDDTGRHATEWGGAWLEFGGDGSVAVRQGRAGADVRAIGLGIVAPIERVGDGLDVLASAASDTDTPHLIAQHIAWQTGTAAAVTAPSSRPLIEGELRAWEPAHRIAIAYGMDALGSGSLRVIPLRPEAHESARFPLRRAFAMVDPRGISAGNAAFFAVSEFDIDSSPDGHCLAMDQSRCVTAGAVTVLRVDATGMTPMPVVSEGLLDTFSLDAAGHILLFYVGNGSQRAARLDPATGAVNLLGVAPPADLPPIDHLALIRCAGESWLGFEVLVSADDAGGESAVMAVPAECLLRSE